MLEEQRMRQCWPWNTLYGTKMKLEPSTVTMLRSWFQPWRYYDGDMYWVEATYPNQMPRQSVPSDPFLGTRVHLLQAGLNHWHWPHAARRWCFMQNVLSAGGKTSPWEQMFGEKFDGPLIPFGCSEGLRFDPTSSPGLFLGYAIHPRIQLEKWIHDCTN